jgi:hypothetical protein
MILSGLALCPSVMIFSGCPAVCLPVLYNVHFAPFPGFYAFGGLLSVFNLKSLIRGILGVVCACHL